ncbi:MAG: translation initiation factor IF-2 [Candidatus Cloacimonadaceae bacterium]|nr:translation initiation factor IF-2 [Candidatus Cloacimonadaceae bacterium]MDP3114528.1 translation initiation factor IF-2 [Candidatus Cloacimonadaceae bacterium]
MQIRVHELAKELRISTMALKKHLIDLGVITKSHMSFIEEEIANRIRQKYNEQVDAEKRAERDRKRFIEQRQAAKAKPITTSPAIQPVQSEPERIIEPETVIEEPILPAAHTETKVEPEPLPTKTMPVAPPNRIIVPYTQAKSTTSSGTRDPRKPRSYTESHGNRDRLSQPKPGAPHTDRGRPDLRKKPDEFRRKPAPGQEAPKPIPIPVDPAKEAEEKKFGKAKVSHEELGDKSKHKKAIITSTKKSKQKVAEPVEIDEAQISRNIKKTMQKSGKRKKYHREAQFVSDSGSNQIVIREYTSVSELAKIMNVSPAEIISKFFMMGQLVTMNQRMDKDSLEMICDEFKVDFRFEDEYGGDIIDREKEQYLDVEEEPRPPVVTIMGHVDHGKTSILDYIRSTNIVAGESGGITQHIGAYQIEINKHKITFLDTPGHEAFTAMRARGANVTDIAVIVVAGTEGMKPQTREAIDHAKAAGVQIIIAINKIDLPETNIDRVIAQLLDYGVYLEQYGGDVPWCKTSVVTGEGILNLIEVILLTAELMELKAKTNVPGEAVVIESEKDTRMGSVATVLMRVGTLKRGDIVVCGATHGRIRRMENERGTEIKVLYPSDVARVYGLSQTPKAGDVLNQVDTEKTARGISTERQQVRLEREKYQNKSSLQNIFARIKENQINDLNIIMKTDTDGSAEALADSFQKISNDEVQVNIIHKSVGGINEADVTLASASDAIIIGFHVRANQQARKLAEDEGVEIKLYQVIYDAIEDVRNSLEGMLKPEFNDIVIGSATIKQVFKIKKLGTIAGCQVDRGVIRSNCKVRLYRNDVLITEDALSSLKHYANDVKEARAGTECGLSLKNFGDIKEGDVLECYIIEEVSKKLQ